MSRDRGRMTNAEIYPNGLTPFPLGWGWIGQVDGELWVYAQKDNHLCGEILAKKSRAKVFDSLALLIRLNEPCKHCGKAG